MLGYSRPAVAVMWQWRSGPTDTWIVASALILFMGLRPVNGVFVDMTTYNDMFMMASGANSADVITGDVVFDSFLLGMAKLNSATAFFLVCAAVYIGAHAAAVIRVHRAWSFPAFLCFTGAFSFWSYGVNGIRNGMACSLFVLALSLWGNPKVMLAVMLISVGMHKSLAVPFFAFLFAWSFPSKRLFFVVWIVALFASSTIGSSLTSWLGQALSLSEGDDTRVTGYLVDFDSRASRFRFDFLLYSTLPIVITYWLAPKGRRESRFYKVLLGTYIISNSFWILAMYGSFSNRFAYLSWFLMPWVMMYPYLPVGGKEPIAGINNKTVTAMGIITACNFSFTFLMHEVFYKSVANQ
jgi:hypothetical protein